MSSLQVHETRSAVVTNPTANWTVDYIHGGGAGTLYQSVLPFLIVVPVVIGISWLAMMWFVRELYYEFGCVQARTLFSAQQHAHAIRSWAIFHIVGANPAAKSECAARCIPCAVKANLSAQRCISTTRSSSVFSNLISSRLLVLLCRYVLPSDVYSRRHPNVPPSL